MLMGVKPARTINRATRNMPTTRSNWEESKRGADDG